MKQLENNLVGLRLTLDEAQMAALDEVSAPVLGFPIPFLKMSQNFMALRGDSRRSAVRAGSVGTSERRREVLGPDDRPVRPYRRCLSGQSSWRSFASIPSIVTHANAFRRGVPVRPLPKREGAHCRGQEAHQERLRADNREGARSTRHRRGR